jgi:class 3 adenylate cyclase
MADVSVLFTDLVGFTALTRRVPPHALVAQLDAMFSSFDTIVGASGLVKIKTIGDAYMAVGGALSPSEDHLGRCVCAALAMLAEVERRNGETGSTLTLRVGVHTGPAIGGVIGRDRLSYDLWGETVNIASRLESSGIPGKVHVSQAVVNRLGARFKFERRGVIELKGIGPMQTHFVVA